jgi:hypothetical protein
MQASFQDILDIYLVYEDKYEKAFVLSLTIPFQMDETMRTRCISSQNPWDRCIQGWFLKRELSRQQKRKDRFQR